MAYDRGLETTRSGVIAVVRTRSYNLSLRESYIVGDACKETGAGRSAGCRSIILDRSSTNQISRVLRIM